MVLRRAFLGLAAAGAIRPKAAEEDFKVYTEHPRLFLTPRRLKLLRRERDRQSMRWQQFETLIAGKARMPEPGFAVALFAAISDRAEWSRQAVEWALRTADPARPQELRQVALVFDWLQPALADSESAALAGKLRTGIASVEQSADFDAVRARALAAVALAGHVPTLPEAQLRNVVQKWWEGSIAPAVRTGRYAPPRDQLYPLLEILHAVRDNLNIDLRESARAWFKDLPKWLLLTYYPATYPAAENEYRIPMFRETGEPDLTMAALSRAAELSLVAYESNAVESQFLQGWLIHDRFLLRGAFGIPYEYMWANPYQPGLSYYHVPLVFHDTARGNLFLRSSWEEDAVWVGCADGLVQVFEEGRIRVLKPRPEAQPIHAGAFTVLFGRPPLKFAMDKTDARSFFLIGLAPNARFHVEADDEEMREERSDAGGILPLSFPEGSKGSVRVAEYKP